MPTEDVMMFIRRSLLLVASTAVFGCFQQGDLNGQPCVAPSDCDGGQTCASGVCVADSYQPCVPGPCDATNGPICDDECTCTYSVMSYQCPLYTYGTSMGDGGGKIFEICGEIDHATGAMTIHARRYDGMTLEDRPYQVRVSDFEEDCGPVSDYTVISDDDPVGEGTSSMRFEFLGEWRPEHRVKDYCVTASKQAGDPDYDPTDPEQESWWWSDKLTVQRDCLHPSVAKGRVKSAAQAA
jgi:hypothetical protein